MLSLIPIRLPACCCELGVQCEIKRRSGADRSFSPDPCMMPSNNPRYGCEPDAGPLDVTISMTPLKRREQAVHVLHVKTCPLVTDKVYGLARLRLLAELNTCVRGL